MQEIQDLRAIRELREVMSYREVFAEVIVSEL